MKYTSSLFDDVRNTLGSIVGSSSWSGSYIRIKNTQTSSRTATQAATRGQFKAHSKAWAALTPAQRTDWNSLAQAITKKDKLGNNYHPTGLQTFVSCNMLLQNLDGGTISTPPSIPDTPPTLASLTLTATVEVAATPYSNPLNHMEQRHQPHPDPGRIDARRRRRNKRIRRQQLPPSACHCYRRPRGGEHHRRLQCALWRSDHRITDKRFAASSVSSWLCQRDHTRGHHR